MADLIKENDKIIIKRDKVLKSIHVRKGRKIWLERVKFSAEELIGQPYGYTFEVQKDKLIRIKQDSGAACNSGTEKDNGTTTGESEEGASKDNRNLTDSSENQKMSKDEIQALRKQGATGQDIVGQLIENSATFKAKTEFAQQKYIKKKNKKYVPRLTVLKPTTRLIIEMYYNRGPIRICNLRPDSLAQVLAHSNVRAGNKMLVVESCVGLMVAALMERMAGQGELIHLYSGSAPVQQAVECYNFTKEQLSVLHNYPLEKVASLLRPGSTVMVPETESQPTPAVGQDVGETSAVEAMETDGQGTEEDNNTEGDGKSEGEGEDTSAVEGQEEDIGEEDGDKEGKPAPKRAKGKHLDPVERDRRRARRRQQIQEVKDKIERADMDGLIVACKYHPTPIVLNLIDFVAPSRPIVIFSQYKEPLLDCYMNLRNRGGVVLLKMAETWLREYQVLPNRTHPMVNMSGGGGYILTGTTVVRDNV